jgi:hypothetical protein
METDYGCSGLAGRGSISAADRQSSVQLEPERTAIHFTLAPVLHTVHGLLPEARCLAARSRFRQVDGRNRGDTQSGESGKRNAGAENAGHGEAQRIVSSASESVEIDLGNGGAVTR